MRHLRVLAAALLALSSLPAIARADEAPPEEKAAIAWETSYASALKAASTQHKPLLLAFHTGWCPFCTKMEKTTWKDAAVANLVDKFVAASINADVEKVPVSRYHLTGFPTVIVAEPGGEQVLRLEGYKDAAAVSAYLKAYLAADSDLRKAYDTLRAEKKNPGAMLTIGDFYSSVGLNDQAAETYMKAAKGASGPDAIHANAGAGAALVKAGKVDAGTKLLQAALTAAGDAPTPFLMLGMGRSEAAQGRSDSAKQWFNRLVAEHPESPEAAMARKELART